jgi:hypothetical protein
MPQEVAMELYGKSTGQTTVAGTHKGCTSGTRLIPRVGLET